MSQYYCLRPKHYHRQNRLIHFCNTEHEPLERRILEVELLYDDEVEYWAISSDDYLHAIKRRGLGASLEREASAISENG